MIRLIRENVCIRQLISSHSAILVISVVVVVHGPYSRRERKDVFDPYAKMCYKVPISDVKENTRFC